MAKDKKSKLDKIVKLGKGKKGKKLKLGKKLKHDENVELSKDEVDANEDVETAEEVFEEAAEAVEDAVGEVAEVDTAGVVEDVEEAAAEAEDAETEEPAETVEEAVSEAENAEPAELSEAAEDADATEEAAIDNQDDGEEAGLIERLLEQPYWVIDLLPSQVPEDAGGQFFALEQAFLDGLRHLELRYQFVDVLLKLNCYYDFVVYRGESDKGKLNPKPHKLEKWIMLNEEGLNIVLLSASAPEDALIAIPTDSTCMTLYGPTPELLEQVKAIATASGLFVWMPPQD